jgi:uncharacterized protein YfeS
MEIEWKEYHPHAKAALDAPLFWSEIDDDSPHGNDTGSDLLAAFKRWNKRNSIASYDDYVDRLLSRWGLTKEKTSGKLSEDELSWIRQKAHIALAFAAIKLRGICEGLPAQHAIRALDQRLAQLSNEPERVEKLRILRDALRANML